MSRVCGYFAPILLFASILAVAQSANPSPSDGGITGTVLTENGQIATNMTVCTSVHHKNQWTDETTHRCNIKVDGEGRFTIERLRFGKYELFAINEAEGYSIDNQVPGQDVTISQEQPWQNVTIQLHNRGAVITAVIIDSHTSKIVQNAVLSFDAIDCGSNGSAVNRSEQIHLAAPPNCDLVLIAKARGYKGWIYTESTIPSRPVLRLSWGERKTLNIQLEPLPDQSATR